MSNQKIKLSLNINNKLKKEREIALNHGNKSLASAINNMLDDFSIFENEDNEVIRKRIKQILMIKKKSVTQELSDFIDLEEEELGEITLSKGIILDDLEDFIDDMED